MSKLQVIPHERIASSPRITKKMFKMVMSLSRNPQVVDLPVNANLCHCAVEGWKLGLWFEIRPPYETNVPVIYQLFVDGEDIPSFAQHKATLLREEIDARQKVTGTAYHLFEFPRGSRILDPESGEVTTHD